MAIIRQSLKINTEGSLQFNYLEVWWKSKKSLNSILKYFCCIIHGDQQLLGKWLVQSDSYEGVIIKLE